MKIRPAYLIVLLIAMVASACPSGSRSDQFVQLSGSTIIAFFQDGRLFIDLFAGGGTLEFEPIP